MQERARSSRVQPRDHWSSELQDPVFMCFCSTVRFLVKPLVNFCSSLSSSWPCFDIEPVSTSGWHGEQGSHLEEPVTVGREGPTGNGRWPRGRDGLGHPAGWIRGGGDHLWAFPGMLGGLLTSRAWGALWVFKGRLKTLGTPRSMCPVDPGKQAS